MIRLLALSVAVIVAVAIAASAYIGSITTALEPTPAELSADETELVHGQNAFALDLYRQLKQPDGNLVVSPYSISTALAMTYAGARGETADQMAAVLHFSLPQERLHIAGGWLADRLRRDSSAETQLYTANALWGQKGLPFAAAFVKQTNQQYGAAFHEVDFQSPEAARQTINRWVGEQTREKIPELLNDGDLTEDTRLVLVNALYFKGTWEQVFDKASTRNEPFHLASGQQVQVPMMSHRDVTLPFYQGADAQVLELPYQGQKYSLLIVLPKRELARLEQQLTAAQIRAWLNDARPSRLDVKLPRFKNTHQFQLAKPLQKMGMALPFLGRADFSGMTTAAKLHIDKVVHQAVIEVDEQGTVAAAATAGAMSMDSQPPSFIADHPFLFLLMHKPSGTILFVGRVTNPAETK